MKKIILNILITLLLTSSVIAENLRITCDSYQTIYPDKPNLETNSKPFSLDFEFDFDQKKVFNFDAEFFYFDENSIAFITDNDYHNVNLDGVERSLRMVSLYSINRNSGTAVQFFYTLNKNFEDQYNNLKERIFNLSSGQQMNVISDFLEEIPKKQRINVMYKYNCKKSKQKF